MMEVKPTRKQCCLAMCHKCCGYYLDGLDDCECVDCALYYYMPYRKKEPNLNWMKINPRRKGECEFETEKRAMTEDEKRAVKARLEKARSARKKKDFN